LIRPKACDLSLLWTIEKTPLSNARKELSRPTLVMDVLTGTLQERQGKWLSPLFYPVSQGAATPCGSPENPPGNLFQQGCRIMVGQMTQNQEAK